MEKLKIFFEILEMVITSGAFIFGGIWTYNKFVYKRGKFPRASINHRIIERDLDSEKKLLHLFVEIKNIGDVLLSIESYDVRINKVIPLDNKIREKILKDGDPVSENHRIQWSNIFYRVKNFKEKAWEIEPSENEVKNFDFVIDKKIKTIQVYSYFKNTSKPKREIGWKQITFHDLGGLKVIKLEETPDKQTSPEITEEKQREPDPPPKPQSEPDPPPQEKPKKKKNNRDPVARGRLK